MPGPGNTSVHSFTDLKAFIKYEKKNMTEKIHSLIGRHK